MVSEEDYMRRCFALAKKGQGCVSPNPMVGSVLVYDQRIIGEGFHHAYGQGHAEVNAIASVGKDFDLLKKCTLYVNLEPCSHYGKTPPCAEKIIACGIPKVVLSCADPNDKVNGKGVQLLRMAGVEVKEHVLEQEGRNLNRRFFTYVEKKRPYIIVKWAQSIDGFIAPWSLQSESVSVPQGSYPITDYKLSIVNHSYRAQEDAIMVGTQTLINDNPCLNIRDYAGKNPIRITWDLHARLPWNLHFFDGSQPSFLVVNAKDAERYSDLEKGKLTHKVELLKIDLDSEISPLQQVLSLLHQAKVSSLIVEGGQKLINAVILEK
ncbi:MAG: bifunctional diaminohydroxyphosphoribosylaminopyrimidine deaminase/5-amino-6-(5-phosphoribosylamino)uracil reductase RibD, partial [Bacteroidales bacterium]